MRIEIHVPKMLSPKMMMSELEMLGINLSMMMMTVHGFKMLPVMMMMAMQKRQKIFCHSTSMMMMVEYHLATTMLGFVGIIMELEIPKMLPVMMMMTKQMQFIEPMMMMMAIEIQLSLPVMMMMRLHSIQVGHHDVEVEVK